MESRKIVRANGAAVRYMLNGRTWNGWNLIKVEG